MIRRTSVVLAAAALVAACGSPSRSDRPVALAELQPTAGQTVQGSVWLVQERSHVAVHARVKGLKPGSEHGFHIHEKGDCSDNGNAAGGHFNPGGKPHGGVHGPHHLGDMPSLKADAGGEAEYAYDIPGVLLSGGEADLMGKAVIVHANPDDYTSQPSGNAGARIACGVILAPIGGEGPRFPPSKM